VVCHAGPLHGPNCLMVGDAPPSSDTVNTDRSVTIQAYDEYENPLTTGGNAGLVRADAAGAEAAAARVVFIG